MINRTRMKKLEETFEEIEQAEQERAAHRAAHPDPVAVAYEKDPAFKAAWDQWRDRSKALRARLDQVTDEAWQLLTDDEAAAVEEGLALHGSFRGDGLANGGWSGDTFSWGEGLLHTGRSALPLDIRPEVVARLLHRRIVGRGTFELDLTCCACGLALPRTRCAPYNPAPVLGWAPACLHCEGTRFEWCNSIGWRAEPHYPWMDDPAVYAGKEPHPFDRAFAS
jgi:hypothetical protein